MKSKMKTRVLSLLLCIVMLVGVIPTTAFAYFEEPTPEGNDSLETTVYDYTKPVGVTMQRLTGNCVAEFGEDGNLGDDFLFVIKSGDRYYAMKDVPASETAYNSIPAVDVTDWVNADGSLTVPADTLDVAFWRYEVHGISEYGMFVNGRNDHITYTYSYESVDGDNDYYNDAERNYWGKYVVVTYEEGSYTNTLYYWSENEVSGTLNFSGRWNYWINDYRSISLKYELITDLRDNGIGGKEFYFRYLGTNVEYVGDEVEGYLYYTDCRHQGTIRHAEYDAPTCMLKGCEEYWYCENCNRYAKDKNFTEFFGEEMPIIPATGHDFDNEKCKNCDRPVPVYSKVTNQAQFDALADDTMFILVAEYNGKHYAMDFSEVYSYMTDSDGDGFYDIHNVDDDSGGIPDYLEFDEGGGGEWRDEPNGIYDYLEWDMDDDGDVDDYDLHEFHLMVCDQHLTDMLYNNDSINATEIKINPDGTFSHEEAKKTAEFEMVDVYLAEDYNPDWHNYWENGEIPYHTKCIKQFVIPNYFLSAPSMRPIERMYQQRTYDFGDSSHWGVIFYDNREEYYSYTDGDMNEKLDADGDGKADPLPFPDYNKEGSVAVFDTFDDIMWILYDEGQMAQLRLRDYNDTIGFVTGHSWELDGWEWVDDDTHEDGGYYDTNDTQACVYLYASAQYDSHTCDFGDWVDDEVSETHTRKCKDPECGKTETEPHGWDNGVQNGTPTCTEGAEIVYTCTGCGKTKTEDVDNLGHDWGEWTYDSVDSHVRSCKRNCGVEQEIGGHDWGRWVAVDGITHKMTCDICKGEQTGEHDWDNGTVTKEPTEWETGVMTYTCGTCSHTKTEPIDKLEHIHDWSDWVQNNETTHIRSCRCNETQTEDHNFDDGVVTEQPTHTEKGTKTYTCATCGYSYTEEIPAIGHDHKATVTAPTCTEQGFTTYTCSCGDSYVDDYVAPNGHTEVIDASVAATCTATGLTEGKHCSVCNEILVTQTEVAVLGHDFADEWTVDVEPTTESEGQKSRHCSRCDEVTDVIIIAKLVEIIDSTEKFTDVVESWSKAGIDYVVSYGYMNGTGNGSTFSPTDTMTRAMIVSVLHRIAGKPTPTIKNPFSDLEAGQTWYHEAVIWAYENGIVTGTSATTFAPAGAVTREQMATFLYRFAKHMEYDTSKSADLSKFPDEGKVGSWAKDALAWANAEGLITGAVGSDGVTRLDPQGAATREQVATILMRFCQGVENE